MDENPRTGLFSRLFRKREDNEIENEIVSMLNEGQEQGEILESEAEMITNMSTDQFVDIAVAKRSGGIKTIPGETGHEGVYDVYRIDDSGLYKMVLELFYEEEQ